MSVVMLLAFGAPDACPCGAPIWYVGREFLNEDLKPHDPFVCEEPRS